MLGEGSLFALRKFPIAHLRGVIILTPWVAFLYSGYMPGRKIPLITGQTYHVLNRGIAEQRIFLGQKDYDRALETILYYQNAELPLRYSFFKRLPPKQRGDVLISLKEKKKFLIDLVAYCFMPSHIHLLIIQRRDGGISKFMSNFTNGYTRYFNTKRNRRGPIFQGKFKAVRIETDEQLLHVSRYIHLNPYTSYIVKTFDQLEQYSHSSLGEYTDYRRSSICQKDLILNHFSNSALYKGFVLEQANHQRELEKIKHLTLEE